MLKRYLTEIKNIVNDIIEYHSDVLGREEDISAVLAYKITSDFMKKFKSSFDGKVINDVNFEVYIYKKKTEEPITGADLGGIVELNYCNKKIVKAYLAQAKIGTIKKKKWKRNSNRICISDKNIQDQAKKMLSITSDSFFFIYSNIGFYVIPANEVKLYGKNYFYAGEIFCRKLENFYELFLTCFVGDHKIASSYNDISDLERISKEFDIDNLLLFKVFIPEDKVNEK